MKHRTGLAVAFLLSGWLLSTVPRTGASVAPSDDTVAAAPSEAAEDKAPPNPVGQEPVGQEPVGQEPVTPGTPAKAEGVVEKATTAPGAEAEASAPGVATGGGLRVYVDPRTGEITTRPSAEQVQRLNQAVATSVRRPAGELQVFALPGGGHGVRLDGRFSAATVIRLREDGSAEHSCVSDLEKVKALLESTPAPLVREPRPRVEK